MHKFKFVQTVTIIKVVTGGVLSSGNMGRRNLCQLLSSNAITMIDVMLLDRFKKTFFANQTIK